MKLAIRVALGAVVLTVAVDARTAGFYACYTRLDYQQPQDPETLGRIPVNASRVFAGKQADPADKVARPPKKGAIRWGPYSDLMLCSFPAAAGGADGTILRSAGWTIEAGGDGGRITLQHRCLLHQGSVLGCHGQYPARAFRGDARCEIHAFHPPPGSSATATPTATADRNLNAWRRPPVACLVLRGTPAPGGAPGILASSAAVCWALVFVRALVTGILGRGGPPGAGSGTPRPGAGDPQPHRHRHRAAAVGRRLPLRPSRDSRWVRAPRTVAGGKPHVDVPPVSWHRAGFSLAAGVAMLVAGLLLVPKPGPLGSDGKPDLIASSETTLPPGSPRPRADRPAPRRADPAKAIPGERPALRPSDTAAEEHGKRPEPDSESRSEGAMARHASGESRGSQSASNSSSSANGGGAKSEPGDNEPGKPPKPRESKRQTAGQPKANPQEEKQGRLDRRPRIVRRGFHAELPRTSGRAR
jgi:hypothetical protein